MVIFLIIYFGFILFLIIIGIIDILRNKVYCEDCKYCEDKGFNSFDGAYFLGICHYPTIKNKKLLNINNNCKYYKEEK